MAMFLNPWPYTIEPADIEVAAPGTSGLDTSFELRSTQAVMIRPSRMVPQTTPKMNRYMNTAQSRSFFVGCKGQLLNCGCVSMAGEEESFCGLVRRRDDVLFFPAKRNLKGEAKIERRRRDARTAQQFGQRQQSERTKDRTDDWVSRKVGRNKVA